MASLNWSCSWQSYHQLLLLATIFCHWIQAHTRASWQPSLLISWSSRPLTSPEEILMCALINLMRKLETITVKILRFQWTSSLIWLLDLNQVPSLLQVWLFQMRMIQQKQNILPKNRSNGLKLTQTCCIMIRRCQFGYKSSYSFWLLPSSCFQQKQLRKNALQSPSIKRLISKSKCCLFNERSRSKARN